MANKAIIYSCDTKKPIIRVRHRSNGEGIEVLIYQKDTMHIFNKTCNFFDEIGYNIAAAKIFTTQHNYALNLFDLLDANPKNISYEGLFKFIEIELGSRLENSKETKQQNFQKEADKQHTTLLIQKFRFHKLNSLIFTSWILLQMIGAVF